MMSLAQRIEHDPRTLELFKSEPRKHLSFYKTNPKNLKGIDSFDLIYTRLRYGYLLANNYWLDESGEIEAMFADAFEKIDKMSDVWVRVKRRVLVGNTIETIEEALAVTDTLQDAASLTELKHVAQELTNLNNPG